MDIYEVVNVFMNNPAPTLSGMFSMICVVGGVYACKKKNNQKRRMLENENKWLQEQIVATEEENEAKASKLMRGIGEMHIEVDVRLLGKPSAWLSSSKLILFPQPTLLSDGCLTIEEKIVDIGQSLEMLNEKVRVAKYDQAQPMSNKRL